MLPSPQALENGWLAGLLRASCRWYNRLARSVIGAVHTQCITDSLSQRKKRNVMWPSCGMLQLPEPKRNTFTFMSTTAPLHTSSTLVNYWNYTPTQPTPSSTVASSSDAGWLAGWLWLAVPPTSRNPRLLPLSSKKLVQSEPKWHRVMGAQKTALSATLEPRWRRVGVRFRRSFLISSNGCIQSIPRRRKLSKPHHLTSAFLVLISILLTCSLYHSKFSRFSYIDCHIGYCDMNKPFYPHITWRWKITFSIQWFPNSHGSSGRFLSKIRDSLVSVLLNLFEALGQWHRCVMILNPQEFV